MALCYCPHQLTKHRSLGERLGSLISGTRRLKKKEEYFRDAPLGCGGSEAGPTWRKCKIQVWLRKVAEWLSGCRCSSLESLEMHQFKSLRKQRLEWLKNQQFRLACRCSGLESLKMQRFKSLRKQQLEWMKKSAT